jgi:hypothetical protein
MNDTKLYEVTARCSYQDNINNIVYDCVCCADVNCVSYVCGNTRSPIICPGFSTLCTQSCNSAGYKYNTYGCIPFKPEYITETITRTSIQIATTTATAKINSSSSNINTGNILLINILIICLCIKFIF